MALGNHPFVEKFLRAVNIAGNVYELNASAGAGANNTTIARYTAGGSTTSRRFRPTQTTTTSNAVPSVGTAAANDGWRESAAQDATNRIGVGDDNWQVKLRYRRSGQSLEVDQSTRVTVIVYRVTSAGTFVNEIGRQQADFTWTTTVQTRLFSFAPGDVTLDAGDKIQLEVYVQTLVAGVPTAPTVATDLWLTIDETSANGAKLTAPNYLIQYVRSQTTTMRGVASLTRDLTLARTLAATMVGAATIVRKTSKTLSATMVGAATIVRKTALTLSTTMRGVASLTRQLTLERTITATMRGIATLTPRLTLFRTLAARMAGVATLARRLTLHRTLTATMLGRAAGYLRLPFDKVPTGGGSTTIRKILNIFDD